MSLELLAIVGLLTVLFVLGVHTGFALAIAGFFGIWWLVSDRAAFSQIESLPFNAFAVYTLTVIPMFLLMGEFFHRAGYTASMYRSAQLWFGAIRGGLPIATTVGSAAFGAVTGSSVANAGMFSRIALPEMVSHGVNKRMALGIVAAAGTVASLIPPSLLMVVFGIMTEQSVSVLLIAGIVPGALSTIVYIIGIYAAVRVKPDLAPRSAQLANWVERFRSILPLWTVAAIFIIVVGGIYLGIFTPTQAAAVGAVATLFLGLLTRRFSPRTMLGAITDSMVTSASIMLIMLGGAIFARMLSYSGLVREFSSTLLGWDLPSWVYLGVYLLLLLILGMFLEAFSLLAIVVPLMYPLLMDLGYHPVWIAILTIKALEIGLVTPPVGLNLYVVKASAPMKVSLKEVITGVTPFILLDVVTLGILIAFPAISLWLPNQMG